MSKATTRIVYLGKSVADGRMAVNDLAPALQSVGILCEETNALLNPGVAKAEVFVHATQPGSFDVSFELAQTALQQPETLLQAEIIVSAVEILRVLGFSLSDTRAAASSISNLIQFIKWIGGRRIDRAEPEQNGSVQVRIGDVQGDVNINTYNSVPYTENSASDEQLCSSSGKGRNRQNRDQGWRQSCREYC